MAKKSLTKSLTDKLPPEFLKGTRKIGNEIMLYLLLSRLARVPQDIGESRLRREALQTQASTTTPESLYYQAALPQAQEEEAQARQALLTQLSGGILGPSLPRGYRVIGRQ